MPRQKRRDVQIQRHAAEKEDELNKATFLGEKGIVAQDLPKANHGTNVVDSAKEIQRNLPQQHGGAVGEHSEGGLRGDRNIGAAAHRGHRGKN